MKELASLFSSATRRHRSSTQNVSFSHSSLFLLFKTGKCIVNVVSWFVNIHMCIVTGHLKDCNPAVEKLTQM